VPDRNCGLQILELRVPRAAEWIDASLEIAEIFHYGLFYLEPSNVRL
jgi:hypothetical protein